MERVRVATGLMGMLSITSILLLVQFVSASNFIAAA